MNIDFPKICNSDFGVAIPFTQLCLTIDNIFIVPRGVAGRLRGDLSFGLSNYQWMITNLTLNQFQIGNVEQCSKYQTSQTCREDEKCGWCGDRNQCLTAREDRKSDICKICSRCSFFYSPVDSTKDACIKKNSCGFCDISGTCIAGDELGPFDSKGKCRSMEPLPEWQFSTREDDKKEGEIKGALSVGGIFIGISTLLIGVVIGGIIVGIIFYKRRNQSYETL